MKLWHFSDSHGQHKKLTVPDNIDIAIFSGDAGNYRDVYRNEIEVRSFLDWYKQLNIPYKIMIAGNHDSSIERKFIKKEEMHKLGIIYLEDDLTIVEGLLIYGSPWTPTFNNWSFNMSRHKLYRVWDAVPSDIDILVTHGPPKGILDITENTKHNYEFCGCNNLRFQIEDRIKPKYHMFGHIHDRKGAIYRNSGVLNLPTCDTVFSNGSVVADLDLYNIHSNGNVFEI
jgi:Icc-related predicted phosphoesterase